MTNDLLRKVIAREEAQLAELSHKHNKSRERLAALKTELVTLESIPVALTTLAIKPIADTPTNAEGNIFLFSPTIPWPG